MSTPVERFRCDCGRSVVAPQGSATALARICSSCRRALVARRSDPGLVRR